MTDGFEVGKLVLKDIESNAIHIKDGREEAFKILKDKSRSSFIWASIGDLCNYYLRVLTKENLIIYMRTTKAQTRPDKTLPEKQTSMIW